MRKRKKRIILYSALVLTVVVSCGGSGTEEAPAPSSSPPAEPTAPESQPQAAVGLPAFDDYPVAEQFTGEPAEVDLASHENGATYRTALTRDAAAGAEQARFAGHYRIVVIGCGASCKEVWAVDLEDGSLHRPFAASVGVAYRPDSRLIVENDPAYYEGLLAEMTVAEVEELMATYGPPRFWVEKNGAFARVGPESVRIDPESKKLVGAASASSGG